MEKRTSTFWCRGNIPRAMPLCFPSTVSLAGALAGWVTRPMCRSNPLSMTGTLIGLQRRPATAFASALRRSMGGSTPGWGLAVAKVRPGNVVDRNDVHQLQPASAIATRRHQPTLRAGTGITDVSQHHGADGELRAAAGPGFPVEADQQYVAQLSVVDRYQRLEGDSRNL